MGLEAKSALQAAEVFSTVKDWVCTVEKKTNGKYRNFYIKSVYEKQQTEAGPAKVDPAVISFMNGDDSALDDDLPF